MGIGKTLSDILAEKGSNPNEISERTGIPSSTIYSIIRRDNMKVDITILAKICQVLNVSMERFYNEYYNGDGATDFILNEHEKCVITAYRDNPDMQPAVDRLLGIKE